jgi:hypothetical protein
MTGNGLVPLTFRHYSIGLHYELFGFVEYLGLLFAERTYARESQTSSSFNTFSITIRNPSTAELVRVHIYYSHMHAASLTIVDSRRQPRDTRSGSSSCASTIHTHPCTMMERTFGLSIDFTMRKSTSSDGWQCSSGNMRHFDAYPHDALLASWDLFCMCQMPSKQLLRDPADCYSRIWFAWYHTTGTAITTVK